MNTQKFVWGGWLCLLVASLGFAQSTQPPSLLAEPDRIVPTSRGSNAQGFQIASAILKQTRRINLVLPASYSQSAADRRYPVIILLDGEANVPRIVPVSDELSRNGLIPESIIVAIENTDPFRGRVHDLTPPGLSVSGSGLNEGGDRFLDFIEKELLPAVDRQFRGSAPRTIIGHSSGGILVTYAAATRKTFRACISIDAPIHLGENWLAQKLTAAAKANAAPLRYVSLDARFGWSEEAWQTLVAAAPASWRLYRESFKPKESHESLGLIAMYLGLREAFSDYALLAAPVAPTTSILPYYAKVSASLGASVIPPRKLVQTVIEDLLMEGRGAAAREAYNTLVAGYGAPQNRDKLLAQIAEVERQPPPTETVEGLLATPLATPEEARALLGEWVGDEWMNPDEPRTGKNTLRIRVVDGRVVGETVFAGGALVMRWEYLKITPTGVTYGYMNGMRPRGVLLYEGKLEGDTFSGQMRMGGVNFKRPDGMPPDPVRFSYKRIRSASPKSAEQQSGERTKAPLNVPPPEAERDRTRDAWQRPAEVFAALGVQPGQRIADIGSGSGYFTFRLAARVGAAGKVYAVDIDEKAVQKVRERAAREKLTQIEAILGASADPRLPDDLDAVLIVDTYHEFRAYEQMLQAVWRALKPGGRLVIIDGEGPADRPRTEYHRLHVIPAELVRTEVTHNGFVFKETRPGFYDAEYGKKMYFLIFEKPSNATTH
jgi:predicted methyltransferase